jgi:hypothetical protein
MYLSSRLRVIFLSQKRVMKWVTQKDDQGLQQIHLHGIGRGFGTIAEVEFT